MFNKVVFNDHKHRQPPVIRGNVHNSYNYNFKINITLFIIIILH